MIISRVCPPLIKLSHMIKFSCSAKTPLLSPSRLSVNYRGAFQIFPVKSMSTDVDKELNSPKRHFDFDQLIAKKDQQNVVIIDVREYSEIKETGKIPGSIHIPLAELKEALGEMSADDFKKHYKANKPQKDTEVIFSCKAGSRSLKALKLGLELGYIKAGNYKGGWLDWAKNTKTSK